MGSQLSFVLMSSGMTQRGGQGFEGCIAGRRGCESGGEAFLEVWESVRAEVDEIADGKGGRVLLGVSGAFRGGSSGAETEARAWYVVWLVDGKISRWKLIWDRSQALEAAGLRE